MSVNEQNPEYGNTGIISEMSIQSIYAGLGILGGGLVILKLLLGFIRMTIDAAIILVIASGALLFFMSRFTDLEKLLNGKNIRRVCNMVTKITYIAKSASSKYIKSLNSEGVKPHRK
ncbi:hypothetical protein BB560_001038 [Smittium megazygosporum]|uniref:Uncharacterized protein n=1 Tax=Smittium megazygosporum TaxID=133381 RepID=A0A2T9ZIR1_9FUNG|nr:hypothetical protein BB560_001038 [Smittium megazygosporum]